jgi:DNA-dependent metalloprotease WSS1
MKLPFRLLVCLTPVETQYAHHGATSSPSISYKSPNMPINSIRLNHQKSSHPNDRIIFIKPRPRPPAQQADFETADLFLRAIAAQCLPIMKKHWLSVTTLEEHEPNSQFLGQNFNHGECIQLVLRSKSGRWLPFEMVQMVMMHELAHNAEMNHSKRFWAKRNEFAGEMRELWAKGYTGEGFWGSGRALGEMDDAMGNNVVASGELKDLPLCGGAYRSRRRKRKVAGQKEEPTWKEKKERRIEKKFGKNGVSLGSDEDARMMYELGKGPVGGNPRVAQSKRGRELRAAAALARFEKSEQEESVKEEETVGDEYEDEDGGLEDALDSNGQRLLDAKGQSMVKICGEEDADDVQVKQEMDELAGLGRYFRRLQQSPRAEDGGRNGPTHAKGDNRDGSNDGTATATPSPKPEVERSQLDSPGSRDRSQLPDTTSSRHPASAKSADTTPTATDKPRNIETTSTKVCSVCSLTNDSLSPTCAACAHVLDPRKDRKHWRCESAACKDSASGYVNSGDAGVCGICGTRRS